MFYRVVGVEIILFYRVVGVEIILFYRVVDVEIILFYRVVDVEIILSGRGHVFSFSELMDTSFSAEVGNNQHNQQICHLGTDNRICIPVKVYYSLPKNALYHSFSLKLSFKVCPHFYKYSYPDQS